MPKYWAFGGAWEKNERMVRQRGVEREGAMDMPEVEVEVNGKRMKKRPDSALGFESGVIVYKGDEMHTVLGEVPTENGVDLYTQGERGGTYVTHFEKTREGRLEKSSRARRIFGGF